MWSLVGKGWVPLAAITHWLKMSKPKLTRLSQWGKAEENTVNTIRVMLWIITKTGAIAAGLGLS